MKQIQFITFEHMLVIIIIALGIGFLAWNRFDIETHTIAIGSIKGEIVERGESMWTGDFSRSYFINESNVYLAHNTEVKLVDGREDQIDLQLIQGRIVLENNLNVSIREIDISTEGQVSIVHYSWLDEIEIAAIEGMTTISYSNQTFTLKDQAIRMQTLEPYEKEYIDFMPEESSEAEFYSWVKNK